MKKLLSICAAAAIVAACTGVSSTKEKNNCDCLICEACDSLDCYAKLDSRTLNSTYIRHSDNFDKWYDSLTILVIEDLEYHYLVNTKQQYINHIVDEYAYNPIFIEILHNGWDGLCGDCYLTHKNEIDIFYDVIAVCNRNN